MDTENSPVPHKVSLPRLVAMFFSPLGMRHLLERPPRSGDQLETARVGYRNSLLLFRHIDAHIRRSAAVVLACFFLQPVVSLVMPAASLYVAVAVLMLAATLHAGILGFYRQVLNQRVSKYAAILGVERPADREEPENFARRAVESDEPRLKATRKLPLRDRKGRRPPR